jgi:Fe-Mn family superoxide dismutase
MKHLLPALPYAVSALEPHVDIRTMMLHHDKHHASYVEALNHALESAPELLHVTLQAKTAEWLMLNPDKVPEEIRTAVCYNAGGHVNHSLLWQMMSPTGGGAPSGLLAEAIDHTFGDFEKFKKIFEEAGSKVAGSGWVWLVKAPAPNAVLEVLTTSGHENPLSHGYLPLLVNDVWEHAYYLKHENRRPEYLEKWWSVTNWKEVEKRFENPPEVTELLAEVVRMNTDQEVFE